MSVPKPGPCEIFTNDQQAGEGWPAIRIAWKRLTGSATAISTLPNRYIRIKEHMVYQDDAEDECLLRCECEITEAYVANRWLMVGDVMVARGFKRYEVFRSSPAGLVLLRN